MMMSGGSSSSSEMSPVTKKFVHLQRLYQTWLDKTVIYPKGRWTCVVLGVKVYIVRISLVGGFYVVSYILAIHYLTIFLLFITPKIAPEMEEEDEQEELPTSMPSVLEDEFRPFVRRLPEFKSWQSAMGAIVLATACTFIPELDIPVFWPILVCYFIILVAATLKARIAHMIKYKYVPWDTGSKKTYRSLTEVRPKEIPEKSGPPLGAIPAPTAHPAFAPPTTAHSANFQQYKAGGGANFSGKINRD